MRPSGDARLVRSASRRLALQAAALVAAAMLLLIVVVTLVVVHGQRVASDDLLRTAARTADDVADPPAGSWIVFTTAQGATATPGLPDELTAPLAALRAPGLTSLSEDNESFRVITRIEDARVVQVVLDLTSEDQQRDRLLRAMGVAALASLALAAGIGALLSHRAVRPLAQALALQRRFVADASHELRTPLTVLSTRAQLLERGLRRAVQDEQVHDDAQGLLQDVHRLGDVIDDLLLAADPRSDAERSLVLLRSIAEGVVSSATAHAAEAQVALVLLDGDEAGPVLGTAPSLRRAVLALVDNAVDHTPAGGQVSIDVVRRRSEVVLTVRDTGPGLPAGEAEQVMDRFRSGGQRAGRAHYGLGLALARDVADRHGGHLRAVPAQVGAAFELELPLLEP